MARLIAVWAAMAAVALATRAPARAAEDLRGDIAFATGDYAGAYRNWIGLAEAGDPSAMAGIGALYDIGHGVRQDFAQALAWYRRAAEAGNVGAMFSTAAMYDNGRGTPVNRAEAVRWYARAAAGGSGRAAYDLGVIYRDGDGIRRDRSEAIHYFRLASAAGIEAARPNLAKLGVTPSGAPLPAPRPAPPAANDQVAVQSRFESEALARTNPGDLPAKAVGSLVPRLDQEARAGSGLADYELGFAYEHGIGIAADPVQAYIHYLRAATSQDARVSAVALQGAASVGSGLTPDQHAAARDALIGGS